MPEVKRDHETEFWMVSPSSRSVTWSPESFSEMDPELDVIDPGTSGLLPESNITKPPPGAMERSPKGCRVGFEMSPRVHPVMSTDTTLVLMFSTHSDPLSV